MDNEFDLYIEEHLKVFKQKQKNKFRNLIATTVAFSLARHQIKDIVVNRIIHPEKITQKLQTCQKKKKKIRCGWMDLPNLNGLFDFLSKHAMTDDIFRKPGRKVRTDDLEDKIDNGLQVNWDQVHVFDAADLLKRYVRCLRSPLIPDESQKCHRQLAIVKSNCGLDDAELRSILQSLFICLPYSNRQVAMKLFILLEHTSHVQSNPESSSALATIFLPCILPCLTPPELRLTTYRDHVRFIIENWSIIAQPPPIIISELRKMCPNCTLICPYYDENEDEVIRQGPLSNIRRRYQRWRNKPKEQFRKKDQFRSTLPRESSSVEIVPKPRRSNSFGGSSRDVAFFAQNRFRNTRNDQKWQSFDLKT